MSTIQTNIKTTRKQIEITMKFPISAIFFFTLVVAAVATNSFQRTLNKTRRNAINDDLNQNHAGVSNVEAKKITKRALDEEKHNPILERAAPFRNKLRDGFLRKDLSGKHHLELNEVSEETKNGDAEPLDLKVIFGGPYENLGNDNENYSSKKTTKRYFHSRTFTDVTPRGGFS